MSEYIDRAELIKYLFETMQAQTTTSGKAYVRDLYDKVLSVPAADVEPAETGKWKIPNERKKTYLRKCSNCGGTAYFCGMGCSYKYCPNCGAKMTED